MILKDGSEVQDARFGRLMHFDECSKNYPIMATVEGKKQRSYTWRCDQTLNQGSEGSCVGHGISHELIARPAEASGIDHKYATEKIYWPAQKIDPWDGGSYPGCSPFYEGTSVLAGVKIAQSLGWFEEYRWAFSLKSLILGVGHNGPAVTGFTWREDMLHPARDGFVRVSGDSIGGHCTLVRAVNVKKRYFTIRNSWGISWGHGGDCYITFDEMDKLIHDRGEMVFFIGRHNHV